jgi:hypothetical protein
MFAASVAALRRAGIENSLTGGLFVFPIIIDITVLIALPFLILDKEMWESRTRIDSHQVNSSSSKS